jgi:hypothetical protein
MAPHQAKLLAQTSLTPILRLPEFSFSKKNYYGGETAEHNHFSVLDNDHGVTVTGGTLPPKYVPSLISTGMLFSSKDHMTGPQREICSVHRF